MELMGVMSLAFVFGLIHAFDADHVLAVSGMSMMRRENINQRYNFCIKWALGHGSSVLLIGSMVLLFGMAIPDVMSSMAEQVVGLMLISIGILLLIDLVRQKNLLMIHHHDQIPLHVHVETSQSINPLHAHRHGTMMIGMLHGVAGSATLLALLPVGGSSSPVLGMVYLVTFCIGVLVSMLFIGGLLGSTLKYVGSFHQNSVHVLRAVLACFAITMGLFWMIIASVT